MAGRDYRGGARVSPARRKEGTQIPDNGRPRNSHLTRQWLAGTFVFSCAMKSRYNETGRVEIRRLTSSRSERSARFLRVSPPATAPLAFRRRNEGTEVRDITCRLLACGWMQTNFLWASHEYLIFIRRAACNDAANWDVTSEQFIWKNRPAGEMKKAQLRARRCNGIDRASLENKRRETARVLLLLITVVPVSDAFRLHDKAFRIFFFFSFLYRRK